MGFIIYCIGAVIACFFSWRKYGETIIDSCGAYDNWIDKWLFWKVVMITFLYPITIPISLLWGFLEVISNKFSK